MTQTQSAGPQRAPVRALPEGPFLTLDRDLLRRRLNAQSCLVHHQLADHPLLTLPRLLELAQRLPAKYVRINNGNAPVYAAPAQIPGASLSIEESFRRIEDGDTRIMLKGIEHDPEYAPLLLGCIAEVEALGHPCTHGIHSRVGYVFISSPRMITPYHMDPEINFLLQVRGPKTFRILSGEDRSVLSEEEIEQFYAGVHESLAFREEVQARASVFHLRPGEGVHIPVNHPHWVETYDEVTISFALTLESAPTKRRGTVYAVNHHLRRCGLRPTPFGRSAWRDALKCNGYGLWRALGRCFPFGRRPRSK